MFASVHGAPSRNTTTIGLGMELKRSGTPRERAPHYRQQADHLHQMAEAESVERICIVLRETAAQYQKLADYLSRPDETGA